MNEEERREYCLTIIGAARKMGIVMQRVYSSDGTRYIWHDGVTGMRVACPPSKDEKEAVYLACEKLVSVISLTKDGEQPK